MTDDRRQIELEIEVPGTPEEVWRAIATGPGITSWYVPHAVEEAQGGAMSASFGDAPEMQVAGRVAEWDPPNRFVMDGGDPSEGLVFEWLVEARDGGSCVVRLINSGFSQGGEWDDQYDAMHEGWLVFLSNLRLHLQHHAGDTATVGLPMTYVPVEADAAWAAMAGALGLPAQRQWAIGWPPRARVCLGSSARWPKSPIRTASTARTSTCSASRNPPPARRSSGRNRTEA